jgi:hypothetical protein
MDHEPDLRVDGHPRKPGGECTNRTKFGKPGLESIIGNDEHKSCQNRVLDISHPGGDIELVRAEFIKELLEEPERADRAACHPADGHAESYKKTYKIHRYSPDDYKMLKCSNGTGKKGSGTGIAV